MARTILSLLIVAFVARPASAESLPSFHLPWAAKAAESIIIVQDGKIAEVWAGKMQVGDSYRPAELVPRGYKVVYGDFFMKDAEIDQELAKKGLKRLATVSGKRLVIFIPPEPVKGGIERYLERHHEYSTVWLEDAQTFAIQQWMNPGPADMRPLEMSEAELKQAVSDLRAIDAKLRTIAEQEDPQKRAAALVDLLAPDSRLANEEVKQAIGQCGPAGWPAIKAALADDEKLPSHGDLIYLARQVAKRDAQETFQRILAAENVYFAQLDAAGKKYDRQQPPHSLHEHRRSAAQWAIDSMK